MFGLIRRLSHSVIPRPDRPWEEDPTSNAPHKPRKRRLSDSEQDDASLDKREREGYVGESAAKRARAEGTQTSGDADEFGTWTAMPQVRTDDEPEQTSPEPSTETQELKEVTKGVKEVELEDKDETSEEVVEEEEKEEEKEEDGEGEEEEEEEGVKEVEPERVPLPDEDEVDELEDDEH